MADEPTREQKNAAIAKACDAKPSGMWKDGTGCAHPFMPDYFTDPKACFEASKKLSLLVCMAVESNEDQWGVWLRRKGSTKNEHGFDVPNMKPNWNGAGSTFPEAMAEAMWRTIR